MIIDTLRPLTAESFASREVDPDTAAAVNALYASLEADAHPFPGNAYAGELAYALGQLLPLDGRYYEHGRTNSLVGQWSKVGIAAQSEHLPDLLVHTKVQVSAPMPLTEERQTETRLALRHINHADKPLPPVSRSSLLRVKGDYQDIYDGDKPGKIGGYAYRRPEQASALRAQLGKRLLRNVQPDLYASVRLTTGDPTRPSMAHTVLTIASRQPATHMPEHPANLEELPAQLRTLGLLLSGNYTS